MRKVSLVLLFSIFVLAMNLAIVRNTGAETYVCGSIWEDTIWDKAGSPYIVTCDVCLLEGITLTIEPSVEVRFQSDKFLQIDGKLVARGTADDKITFTSDEGFPLPGDWGYIKFTDISVDASFDMYENYIDGCILEYCNVRYGGGAGSSGAIWIDDSSPFIHHCTIEDNNNSGMFVDHVDHDVTIANNKIRKNIATSGIIPSGGGIHIYFATAALDGNIISENTAEDGGGIRAVSSTVTMDGNIISENTAEDGGGIHVQSTKLTLKRNTISKNSADDYGGGICVAGATATLMANTLTQNTANNGGGIHGGGCTLTLTQNTITQNTANNGGGIHAQNYGTVTLKENIISQNTANDKGGGIYTTISSTIAENLIIRNSAKNYPAVYHLYGGEFESNRIVGNYASGGDSAIYIKGDKYAGSPDFHCNYLLNPTTYELEYGLRYGDPYLHAENNYWGTNDESEVPDKIKDRFDDPSLGIVLYHPIITYPCEGDFNADGDVDGSDLAVFAADFGRMDCGTGDPCEGDFNADGDVDGSDLAVFAADFGRTDCP